MGSIIRDEYLACSLGISCDKRDKAAFSFKFKKRWGRHKGIFHCVNEMTLKACREQRDGG